MGRYNHNLLHGRNRMASGNTTPPSIKSDGLDVEFSEALADHDDLVAQARSKAADARAKSRK
ncbi:YfhD family protein [Pradoshia sp. D12]|uniref:YfhD family protein n=1 Tax=Bacillaceae TaxID=186817 RepID=UPI00112D870D|nr:MULTISPECIES: YfhD family protein [Bacillaceae]QFK70298.1 YfhD family protein [Pradoshia sp. D12]TPF71079.1 YfhD family protein [Bacillus sp. D12]